MEWIDRHQRQDLGLFVAIFTRRHQPLDDHAVDRTDDAALAQLRARPLRLDAGEFEGAASVAQVDLGQTSVELDLLELRRRDRGAVDAAQLVEAVEDLAGRLDLGLGEVDHLAVARAGLGEIDLRPLDARFQLDQGIARLHPVTAIDQDLLDHPGHRGTDLDLLPRLDHARIDLGLRRAPLPFGPRRHGGEARRRDERRTEEGLSNTARRDGGDGVIPVCRRRRVHCPSLLR